MEKQFKIANRLVKAAAAVLVVFGTVISFLQILNSVKSGIDWYTMVPAVLYILSFGILCLYAFTRGRSSARTFQSVLFAYGLVVFATGVIWQPVFPNGTKWIFLTLSILILVGLVLFNFNWSKVGFSKAILSFTYAVEVITAIAQLRGNPMVMENDTVARYAVWIRPIILGTIAVLYLGRMREKSKAAAE